MKLIPILLLVSVSALAIEAPITSEIYTVQKGDWLSTIAIRKWGEMQKWQDLWKLNQNIKNPDLIYPGQRLRLLDNGQIEFLNSHLEASNGKPVTKFRQRSEEWRLLPKQSWETFIFTEEPTIDPLGFDKRSKVQKRFVNKTPVTSTIATDRFPIHGEIVYARSEFKHIFLGDQVFIRADEPIQVGSVYSVTTGPEKVRSARDGRVGFVYDLVGKVKIIGVRDSSFIATVTELHGFLTRGNLLIPEIKQVEFKKPLPAGSAVTASVVFSDQAKQTIIGEHSTVFLDVGSSDGVQPGMIFRTYLHKDPFNKKEISSADYLIENEMIIMETKDQFSSAVLLGRKGNFPRDARAVALTDLTDFKKHMGMQTAIQDAVSSGTDELDAMDTDQGLGEKEEHELKQLENVDNPEEIKRVEPSNNVTAPGIGDEPAPNDSVLPPETAPEAAPDTGASPSAENLDALDVPEAPPEAAPPPPAEQQPPSTTAPLENPSELEPVPSTTGPGVGPAPSIPEDVPLPPAN